MQYSEVFDDLSSINYDDSGIGLDILSALITAFQKFPEVTEEAIPLVRAIPRVISRPVLDTSRHVLFFDRSCFSHVRCPLATVPVQICECIQTTNFQQLDVSTRERVYEGILIGATRGLERTYFESKRWAADLLRSVLASTCIEPSGMVASSLTEGVVSDSASSNRSFWLCW